MKKFLAVILVLLLAGSAMAEVGMANPWVETDADGVMQAVGVTFGVPEGAENVVYRVLEAEHLAEMDFSWYDMEYTARIKPTDAIEDISGVYCEWSQEDFCEIGGIEGTMYRGQDGDQTVDLCLWYDVVPGLMYSVSAAGPDLDGFDITAAAEQVYVPAQGDVG